jgi:dTDP-4-amino-4,6-dideoxygalactose transaminase
MIAQARKHQTKVSITLINTNRFFNRLFSIPIVRQIDENDIDDCRKPREP